MTDQLSLLTNLTSGCDTLAERRPKINGIFTGGYRFKIPSDGAARIVRSLVVYAC